MQKKAGVQTVVWDYERDEVLIRFDEQSLAVEDLAAVILAEGYQLQTLERNRLLPATTVAGTGSVLARLEAEPAFYREGLAAAAAEGKPILLDFWATWCGPCKRFKQETLRDPEVAALLEGMVVLEIDTDQHPELARAFGVSAVPDIILATPAGEVVERFTGFLDASGFLPLLHGLMERPESAAGGEDPVEARHED